MLPFYIRYINWTLNHEESPPRQHYPVPESPPIIASPPRRKKYNSETPSTESATNASSSQQPVVERTYMSSDTSTRSVKKKKKTSTKALVKRLLSVVADLTSKLDRVLQKKDEPDTGFGEEEEIVNEEEEEPFYHGFKDSIISELDVINYWNDFSDGHKTNATIQFVDTIDAPQQEYIVGRGDCGVFVCMFMEMIVSGYQ
ncbi:unnamed protein product [Lactuca virosa]|uniref:Ubiquitin-like protease family profile domain-containing protein n=1 Tax=Lactuca virosa TaxID=75947 RepID=A0AAU9NDS6_9ASTR|nr:unnamed protein product [Lactuca virosa]